MPAREITEKQLRELAAWERFIEVNLGAYPSTIAAIKLGMTTAGVYNAAQRGWIGFFQVGRDRWYSRRDVINYRHEVCRKFRDNRRLPSIAPKKFPVD